MIEAKIILPIADNSGNDTEMAHTYLKNALLREFGGYTRQNVFGAWTDNGKVYEDQSIAYFVATNDSHADQTIKRLAIKAGLLASQVAVYFTFGGNASIENCVEAA